MGRTNVVVDEELIQKVMRLYKLPSKRAAIDFALRTVAGENDRRRMLDLHGIDNATALGFFSDQKTEGGIAAEIEIDEVVIVKDQHRVSAGLLDLLTQDAKRFSASGDFSFIILVFRRPRE